MSIEDKARHILLDLGLWWPEADSGKLRDAAKAWRAFADSVDDVRSPVHRSASGIIHNNTGESIEAFRKFWGRYATGESGGWLSDLAKSSRDMAGALDKFADAIDDAINKLWTRIAIDAAVIAGGVALAIMTAGIASGAAAAAADAVIEFGATVGVGVSAVVADIVAGAFVGVAFGGVESVTVDLAVAQPLQMATGLQHGFSLDEVNQAAKDGMIFGGALGAGGGLLKASMEGGLTDTTPLLLRPPSLRPDLVDLGPAARNAERTPCVGEPIDVATGAMLMTQTDLALPGTLPLEFTRTHLSSYRGGVCFGPTWISTLDECLQIDGEGVVFAAADGMRLVYPVPEPGVPTMPVKGPRWPLEWDGKPDGAMTVTDPSTGVTRTFAAPVPSPSFGVFHLALDSWSDRNGNRIDVERDDEGIPFGIRHSGGYYVAVDTQGPRITALRLLDEPPSRYRPGTTTDEGTVVMRYGYDTTGNLTEVINSSGEPLRFTYDTEGRVTRWTDRNGTWFGYVYDDRGRVTRTEGIDGILSGALTYDDTTRTTTYTDSQGHVSVHRYNTEGLVVEETDPLGHVTRTEWDEYGAHPVAVTDPLGHTTRYAYDDAGNLTGLVLPDGTAAQAEYNALGLPTKVVEPGGAVWRHTYDDRGNVIVTVDPTGAETRYQYGSRGQLAAVTDALGHTRRIVSNAAGLPITLGDELGHETTVGRDSFGRIIAVTDPLGHTTRMEWSIEGKPTWREYPDGTRESWAWDAEGNLIAHTDLAGNTTAHTSAPFDVPASRTDPDGTRYGFTYDTELRLTGVTNPDGRTWSYLYDEAGRLIAETDFNGRTLTYAYDAAGRLITRVNGVGEVLRFTRDTRGRVVAQETDNGEITTYAYTPNGDLSHAANADAEVVLERDALGRILSETVNDRTSVFQYDALGRRTRRVVPSGLASDWTYDAVGRPAQLRSMAGTLDFSHDAAGREIERRFGEGVTLTQRWNPNGQMTAQSLTSAIGGPVPDCLLQHRTYTYRVDGHLTEIRELTSGTRHFGLDDTGSVTKVRAHGWTETYAYDSTGKVRGVSAPGHDSPGEREFEGTIVRRAGRTTYEHDCQGRLTRRTRKLLSGKSHTWSYVWNAEDRLTEVVTPNGDRWRYAYDPLGRRISKHRVTHDGSPADRVEFSWDDTRLGEQTLPDGKVISWDYEPDTHRPVTQTLHTRSHVPEGASFLSRLAEETGPESVTRFLAVITDNAGSPMELVTAQGEVVWQRRTTLWGTHVPSGTDDAESATCPLRFPGQYFDTESGLHYNYFRYYDPEVARYVSPDPLGLDAAPDHHAYVDAPLLLVDPLGLKCEEVVATPRTGVKGLIKDAQLPHTGRIRFVPDKRVSVSTGLPRGARKGYIDRFGNEWIKGPSRTAGQPFEWDVQLSKLGKAKLGWLSRDGSHLNVSLDGEITHK
ncbi:polymorphic toxin type 17 domain-containing protein [Streptomyces misionensis]|uniref:polymorphic toxin type 17 domain-containing protein n=1 Tax=Streptomyces misionensis TaxID=67331 RepID=UPI000945A4AC|nr:polymorphic toxin type 17 domain-containing protein [Streptomyces misionensis]